MPELSFSASSMMSAGSTAATKRQEPEPPEPAEPLERTLKHTHTYSHPEEKAFGAHHAEVEGRVPFDPEDARTRGLGDYEIEIITLHHERMKQLDLHHGTPIEWSEVNPDGTHRIEWTDREGQPRATSVAPEFFRTHFEPQGTEHGMEPTGSTRQEADYARGEFHRCNLPPGHPSLRSACEACTEKSAA